MMGAHHGESPPKAAVGSLQNLVSELRKLLPPDVLVTRAPGYALDVERDAVDAHRFERLVRDARDVDPQQRVTQLRGALAGLLRRDRLSRVPRARAPLHAKGRLGEDTAAMNLGLAQQAIADRNPDRECIVTPTRRLTYAQVAERARRLANVLHANGLGCHRERAELENHESGQDHVGIYMLNAPEYIESMLGAYLATSLIAHGLDFWTAAILCAFGLVLGALGSGMTLRRFLRV